MSPSVKTNGSAAGIKQLDVTYDSSHSEESARKVIFALCPEWETSEGDVEFVRFKEGITNTLFKAVKKRSGHTQQQLDQEAVLLRAYGNGTHVLIDREREAQSHSLLAKYQLAPPLLARFGNGLLYRYIDGTACAPEDMRRTDVWPATAKLLGKWHGTLPVAEALDCIGLDDRDYETMNSLLPGRPAPNIWTVMQRWILALPNNTKSEQERAKTLQTELEASTKLLGKNFGLSNGGYVIGHCDLLSGNIIILPPKSSNVGGDSQTEVSFIDYEYTTPAPAAFDLANHFAEWGGFECDYNVLPTRSQRKEFIRHYVSSYRTHERKVEESTHNNGHMTQRSKEDDVEQLMQEVDEFLGMPGFYWGIWALIQAMISQIDFDYASYAEVRLAEYWDWKAERENTRAKGVELPLRERRLAQEC